MAIMLKTQLNEQYTREHIVKKKVFCFSVTIVTQIGGAEKSSPTHCHSLGVHPGKKIRFGFSNTDFDNFIHHALRLNF